MKVDVLIPARGGSKGIPKKNIQICGGIPLIAWTIIEAKKSNLINNIFVSTDCLEIAAVADQYGGYVSKLRPDFLATDESTTQELVNYFFVEMGSGLDLLILQPTSPLRNINDIDGVINIASKTSAASIVSVNEVRTRPEHTVRLDGKGGVEFIHPQTGPLVRRQELDQLYEINGAMYFIKKEWFLKHRCFVNHETIGYVMNSLSGVDIDTYDDLIYADYLLKMRDKNKL